MFSSSQNFNFKESKLTQKKHIFRENIRRHQINQVLSEMRELALMPPSITTCINHLPESIGKLSSIICQQNLSPLWERSISTSLFEHVSKNWEIVSTLPPKNQIPIFMIILLHQDLTFSEVESIWGFIELESEKWKNDEKEGLLNLLRIIIEKYCSKFLSKAKKILQNLKKIGRQTLLFLSFVIEKYPKEGQLYEILTHSLIQKLIFLVGIQFYEQSQKFMMVQLLIKLTFDIQEEEIEKRSIINLFNSLQKIIELSSFNFLIDRCLIMIHNLNINVGSYIFQLHSCANYLVNAIADDSFPNSLRQLMVQTFLSSLINFPTGKWKKYLQGHSEFLSNVLTYIAEQFVDNKNVMDNLQTILFVLMNISSDNEVLIFRSWLLGKIELVEAIKICPFGEKFVDEWKLI